MGGAGDGAIDSFVYCVSHWAMHIPHISTPLPNFLLAIRSSILAILTFFFQQIHVAIASEISSLPNKT